LNLIQDSRDNIYFFFTNGIVEASKRGLVLKSYDAIEGCVWEKNIIDFDFQPLSLRESMDSEFFHFIKDITKVDDNFHWKQRTKSICSAMGYMLCRYKDESLTKALVLMDEYTNGSSNGGTGKTLIAKSLGKMRNLHNTDGKSYDHRRWYKFAGVSSATEIILFDDVQPEFDFERLFPMMTTGIEVVRKYKDPFYIPYDKSPKVMLTTNYAINGEGSSFRRRIFEFEVSHYYSDRYKPEDKFGHLFFTDWNPEEWNKFYNLMAWCGCAFLKYGLYETAPLNIRKTKLRSNTCEEFIEFAECHLFERIRYVKQELWNKFISLYPDYRNLRINTFTQWLKKWATFNNWAVNEPHSDVVRYIEYLPNPEESN